MSKKKNDNKPKNKPAKKKDKPKGAKNNGLLEQSGAGGFYELVRRNQKAAVDDEGFQTLTPTQEGTRRLENIRLSRKFIGVATSPAIVPLPYEKYNPNAAITLLDQAISKVRSDKFDKAYKLLYNNEIIVELTDAFINMESALPNFESVVAGVTKLLRVGKTFYEFDQNQRAVIDDEIYDRVLARFRGLGYTEPTAYTPNRKGKTAITYPTLHNNVDKAYVVWNEDPIPKGVKETGTVEKFLLNVYKKLGISSEVSIDLELSPKIDGVSVNGTIVQNCLTDPQTRGDEDSSLKVIGLDNLCVGDVVADSPFGIQYEVFCTNGDMEQASEYLKLGKPYVSNRSAASGIINRLCTTPDDKLLKYLCFYPIEAADLTDYTDSYAERMDYLDNFKVVPMDMPKRRIISGKLTDLLVEINDAFEELEKIREELSFAIDGMVITVADSEYQSKLGRSGRTNTYQIALKFNPTVGVTTVDKIHLDSGLKGYRTIQVDLKHPVFLDGVRYDHVPILSAAIFDSMPLREGSEVEITRVGDVIPSITVTDPGDGKQLYLPKKCPACGKEMIMRNKKLYCANPSCGDNIVGRITGFIGGIGVEGYSDGFVRDVVVGGHQVDSISMLIAYGSTKSKSKTMNKFIDDVMSTIAEIPDYVAIGALGIPDLGPSRARALFREASKFKEEHTGYFKDCWDVLFGGSMPRDLYSTNTSTSGMRLRAIHRVYVGNNRDPRAIIYENALGKVIGESVYRSIHNAKYDSDIMALRKVLKNFTVEMPEYDMSLGHTGINPSDEVVEVCEENGIEIVDGKKFDILLVRSKDSNSTKMQVALKKGLPIYTEQEFLEAYAT